MNSSVSRHLKAPVRQAKTQTQRKSKILQVKYPEDYRFRCSKCSYSGTNLSYLNQHLRTHSSEKPYRCEYCPAMFRFLGGLNQHRRTHTGERPFLYELFNK
ncbi:unnamed protein product [Allacma fusca]|uniref:C2H2-type domain-containing protein n=1 Tax=Allacma fusca TaxID=39272 RepID=A0A8J2PNP3_9HEXA|nr:unnamed protein product [Allacma fusca]